MEAYSREMDTYLRKVKKAGKYTDTPSMGDFEQNPLDELRSRLINFLTVTHATVNCEGQCFACHDWQVLNCFLENKELLEQNLKIVKEVNND